LLPSTDFVGDGEGILPKLTDRSRRTGYRGHVDFTDRCV
jgi:hypothetical protein